MLSEIHWHTMLKRNTFLNIKFENMLNTLGQMSRTDIYSSLKEWEQLTPLPFLFDRRARS